MESKICNLHEKSISISIDSYYIVKSKRKPKGLLKNCSDIVRFPCGFFSFQFSFSVVSVITMKPLQTSMHSSRMRTARSLLYVRGLPDRDAPWIETLRTEAPRQRPPWTKNHWTETPPGQRAPGQRHPWSCDLWCMGQRPPL